jgi:hypothetical protein
MCPRFLIVVSIYFLCNYVNTATAGWTEFIAGPVNDCITKSNTPLAGGTSQTIVVEKPESKAIDELVDDQDGTSSRFVSQSGVSRQLATSLCLQFASHLALLFFWWGQQDKPTRAKTFEEVEKFDNFGNNDGGFADFANFANFEASEENDSVLHQDEEDFFNSDVVSRYNRPATTTIHTPVSNELTGYDNFV